MKHEQELGASPVSLKRKQLMNNFIEWKKNCHDIAVLVKEKEAKKKLTKQQKNC